jgi:ABC-type transport system involved in multi-copper enzyme maturation permease subunit
MKLRRLMTMKAILIIFAIIVPAIYLGLSLMKFPVTPQVVFTFPESTYTFPNAYHFSAYISSWFSLLIGVIIIVFVSNELKYKTQRQNVIDGLSKKDIIMAKFYVVFLLSAAITIYTFLVGFIIGVINDGFDNMFDGIHHIAVYFISTLGYFTFAFFFANLVRLPALAIVLYILSTFVEGIVGFIAVQQYAQFFPLSTFSDLIPVPMLDMAKQGFIWGQWGRTGLALIYIAIFVIISYWVIKKRDI